MVARKVTMAGSKVQKKLPKRVTNVKGKAKRERSWLKNQRAKELRIKEQQRREDVNRERGYTGNDLHNDKLRFDKKVSA